MSKALPLVDFGGTKAMLPTVENILGARYPLNRFLYIYVNKAPGKPLPLPLKEFLIYTLSREGQSAVSNFGAIPLPGDMARMNLGKL
ncbi:MAG: phosphate-binding protein [Holophagaceae bacterium]|nr:phosphate-binding protein [Holophagaceae bacterium]